MASAAYLFAMDWRLAIVALLPFPGFFLFLPRHEGQRRAYAGIRGTARPHQQRHGRVRQRHTVVRPSATVVARMAAIARRSTVSPAPSPPSRARWHHGPCPRDDRAGDGAGPGAGLRPAVRASGLDGAAGRAFALVAPGICAPMLLLHTLLHDRRGGRGPARALQTPTLDVPAPGHSSSQTARKSASRTSATPTARSIRRCRTSTSRSRPARSRPSSAVGAANPRWRGCCCASSTHQAASRWAAPTCGSSTARRCTATSASCCRTCA